MSKGQDSKKTDKKKPAKTMKEKRNDKKDKKANKQMVALVLGLWLLLSQRIFYLDKLLMSTLH